MEEAVKSRKERRKEARQAKQQQRFQSWAHHQASKKQKKNLVKSNSHKVASSYESLNSTVRKSPQKNEDSFKPDSMPSRKSKTKISTAKRSRTKFEEYLEMEKHGAVVSAEEDLAFEMRLAKKLKVKQGKICGPDDGMNDILDGIPIYEGSLQVGSLNKELEHSLEHDQGTNDVMPHSKLKTTKKKSKLKDTKHKNEAEIKLKLKDEQPEYGKMQVTSLKKTKTKFEEFIEMEGQKVSADEDLAMEKHVAKKLKAKNGKRGGLDDGMSDLMDGICSDSDFVEAEPEVQRKQKRKKSGNSSLIKIKSSKPLEGSNSCVKNNGQVLLVDKESSDISAGEDTVFLHDGQVENDEHEESEEHNSESDSFKAKNFDSNRSVLKGGASAKSDKERNVVNSFVKYVAPHLRLNLTNGSDESAQIRRHIRGLLNRLSESNVETIAGEVSIVFQSHGRSLGAHIVGDEVLASCSKGPRGNEQYAAVFAAFVSGIAASVGMDFGAKVLASLAASFEEEYRNGDGLSLRNLTLLLAYLYTFGLCSSDLIYDLLTLLSQRLEELDVSTILTILQCCGMGLRRDDPAAMKDFVVGVQQQVQKLKALPSGTQDGKPKISGKRMEFMLETICEIKNNKKRPKEESTPHNRLKKWLQKLRVEEVQLRGIKWDKLLDPNKKGQWWHSGDIETIGKDSTAEIADVIDAEVTEAQKMLHLASAQRMNTEARRAIFCIIMSGEDYLDAFEKILRLNLPGKQDREILRVLVECCLQEKVFNKYYSLLAAKLCHHDKNHKFTLQYCLWDHFKQLDSMEMRRLANLARFLADLIGSFSLSLAVLKAVDFTDSAVLTSKVMMHFRILFETLFTQHSDNDIWNIFTRIASPPELENLRNGLELFIHQHLTKNDLTGTQFGPTETTSLIVNKIKVVKKALANVSGVLL